MKIKFSVFILIAVICFLAYFNSLHNPFIWDDDALVVRNTLIHNWQNIPKAFSNDLYFGIVSGSNFYRPLQSISFIFDYHFWQLDPFGYHLSNIIMQIGVSTLVFILLFNLLGSYAIAISTTVLFAVTPLHTEAVTYISGRAEMLMGFFVILSLLLFIKSQGKGVKQPKLFFSLAVFSFTLSLLAKEIAIVFPLIIGGYIFYISGEKLKEKYYLIKHVSPFAAVALIYLILRISVFSFSTLRPPALAKISWFVRLSVIPKVILTYCKLLFLPTGLHMSRELVRPTSFVGILVAIFLLGIIIASCIYFLKYSKKNRVASFMLFWALVFFIPQSGVFPINAFVAEHFIYLPAISFFLFIVCFLHRALRNKVFILVVSLLCAFYILLTSARNFEWRNPIVFYRNIIKYSPDSFQAHNNLGLQYEYLGRFDEAKLEYKRAIFIKPDLIEAHANLANLYFKLKLYDQAKAEYELLEKTDLGSKAGETQNNLGNIYEALGKPADALLNYNQALLLDPSLKFTHFNLARIYFSKGEINLAVQHISDSLGISEKLSPHKQAVITDFLKKTYDVNQASEFYNNLGINLAKNKLLKEALSAFNLALELNPRFADCYFNQGLAYLYLGKKSEARFALKQALKIDPNHIRAKRLIAEKLM